MVCLEIDLLLLPVCCVAVRIIPKQRKKNFMVALRLEYFLHTFTQRTQMTILMTFLSFSHSQDEIFIIIALRTDIWTAIFNFLLNFFSLLVLFH